MASEGSARDGIEETLLVRRQEQGDTLVVAGNGAWVIDCADRLDREFGDLRPERARAVRFDLADVERLDTAGAWLLATTAARLAQAGVEVAMQNTSEAQDALLDEVQHELEAAGSEAEAARPLAVLVRDQVARLGRFITETLREAGDFVAFIGLLLLCFGRLALGRQRFEAGALFHHMQQVWLSAMPIVGLLAFLIGVVTLYQGSTQLARFGAQTFAVDLVGITVLREIGALICAVIVAGRSGSSFTAQIGSMKARQEVDAMRAIGIDPITALVVPRVLALLITFPLLVFFADAAGLFGGALVAWLDLGIPPAIFLERLRAAVDLGGFLAGLAKAPVFAILIGVVGCFQGLKVEGSAAEVGARTTRSVVLSVFLVILADALFSLLYRVLGV